MHLTVETKRFDATPPEWLELASSCGELANLWSGRADIMAYVGKGAGQGIAPALFNPKLAEMELNTEQAFVEGAKPEFIGSLTDRDVQLDNPVACGAILHEAGHARHSKYDFSKVRTDKDPRVAMLVEMFEETRVENRMAVRWPANRSFLRACALKLVVSDMKETSEKLAEVDALSLSRLILLTLARVDAGVLEDEDVEPIDVAARKVFDDDLMKKLRAIWRKAQAHDDDEDWRPLRKLAEQWIKALEDAGHKTEPTEAEKQAMRDAMAEIMDQLGEMADETEMRARDEAHEQGEAEENERVMQAAKAKEKEEKEADEEASKIFSKSTRDLSTIETSSRLVKEREPTDAEHKAAVVISRMLERARYRDRVVVKRTSKAPPGRLRGRAMVQAAADDERGRLRKAEPWAAKRRYHTEDPELRVGMMTDISGSMRSAMEPMAATNWIFSEAVRRIQGKVASVYFGNAVFPGLAPGEHLSKVKVYSAADGTERFNSAFKAINGKLDLLNSSGARLLVVVSDLHHTEHERVAERKWFERCAKAGVAVIVMPFDARPYYVQDTVEGLPVRALLDVSDPTAAAMEIGNACAEALTAAGNRA